MKLMKTCLTIIMPNGEVKKRKPAGAKFTLQELQDAVSMSGVSNHDLIEVAPVECEGFVVLVNEEGLLKDFPHNPFAEDYYTTDGFDLNLVGPVVFVPEDLME
jgi:hypothetical protein